MDTLETLVPPEWRDQFMDARAIPGRGLCVVQRFVFTCGLLTGVTLNGLCYDYTARYCYPIGSDALRDLREWDGAGDPPGEWVKEKVSGRARVKGAV